MDSVLISMQAIQKSFGGVQALKNGQLELRKGEVLGLIGENGAGKSTLMKILSGVYTADAGEIYVEGKKVSYRQPNEALHAGICMIYQELNLIQKLSVADNIFIGREARTGFVLNRKKDAERTQEILRQLELVVKPDTIVEQLTVAKQQMIEIAKGISHDSKVLIMDEPTAALSLSEIEELFQVIRRLKERGISIIYISHRLEELFTITDRITIMRDGDYVDTMETGACTMEKLIQCMVGRKVSWEKKLYSKVTPDAPVVFEAVDMDWRKNGKIYKNGCEIKISSPHDAVENGIGYISEDRKTLGLALNLSVADNIALANWEKFTAKGIINYKKQREITKQIADMVAVKMPSVQQAVCNLSGGNQQKVAIAKWLLKNCDILIFDEPTRGIDVGAKSEIYHLINQLVEQGKSVIMISSEMQELLCMSDRILVMCEGCITGELNIEEATQEKIMELAVKRTEIQQ